MSEPKLSLVVRTQGLNPAMSKVIIERSKGVDFFVKKRRLDFRIYSAAVGR